MTITTISSRDLTQALTRVKEAARNNSGPQIKTLSIEIGLFMPFHVITTSCHGSAFLCTALARFGASLTMSGIMLATLFTTGSTYFRADFTYIMGVVAALSHEGGSQTADLRALHIQADALGHHLDVVFFQAGNGTRIAISRANIAGFNARFEFIEFHL